MPLNVFGSSFDGSAGSGTGGIVDQHDDRLALDVDALEVVPVVFGRDDAVADEDHVGVVDRRAVGDVLGPRHDVVAPLERGRFCAPFVTTSGWASLGVMPTSGTFCT